MKKIMFTLLFVIGMIAATISTTSCGDEYFYDYDTIIVVNNNSVNVEGDSIAIDNHLHCDVEGDDINVNGGSTTNTISNNVNSGGNTGNGTIKVPDGYSVWKFSPEGFINSILYNWESRGSGEFATFNRFTPSENEVPICFYDSGADPTTLSFPFYCPTHNDCRWISTDGKFGSDKDAKRGIYCLSVYNTVAEINYVGTKDNLKWKLINGNAYLCGIAGNDGNLPFEDKDPNDPCQKTGRTLIGTDGHSIFLLIAESATPQEAYDTFVSLNICNSNQIMAILGGSSSLGLKKVPVVVSVKEAEKIEDILTNNLRM